MGNKSKLVYWQRRENQFIPPFADNAISIERQQYLVTVDTITIVNRYRKSDDVRSLDKAKL